MKYSILVCVCADHISLKSYSICTKFFWRLDPYLKTGYINPKFLSKLICGKSKGSINISCFIPALGNLQYNLFQQMKHTCTLNFREVFPHMWSTCISASCRSEMVLPVCFWMWCWCAFVHLTAGCIQHYIVDWNYSWGTQFRFVSQEHTCILIRRWLRQGWQLQPRRKDKVKMAEHRKGWIWMSWASRCGCALDVCLHTFKNCS